MKNTHNERKYIIVGASGSIGSELVNDLAESGAILHLVSRDKSKLDKFSDHDNCELHECDTADFEEFDSLCKEIGEIDGIVNLAGSVLVKAAHATSFEEYQDTVETNITTAFSVVRAAGKHLRKNGGSVILFSTAAARSGVSNHEAIATAKAAVIGLAQSAAATYGSNNIRFNVVAPGMVETGLTENLLKSDLARKASEAMHVLGRIGQADEVARVASFLLAEESEWITGQVFGIDGGLSNIKPKMKIS